MRCSHLIDSWRKGCNVDIPFIFENSQRFLFVARLNNLGSQYCLPSTSKRNFFVSHWKLTYKDNNLRTSVLLSPCSNKIVAPFSLMAQAMTTFCPEKWYQRWSYSLWGSTYIHHGVASYFCNICGIISTEIIHESKDLISHVLYFPSQGKILDISQ